MKKNRIPHNYASIKNEVLIAKETVIPNLMEKLRAVAKVTGYDLSELPNSFLHHTGNLEDGMPVMRICPEINPLGLFVDITSVLGVFPPYAIQAGIETLLLGIVSEQQIEEPLPAHSTR